MNKKIYTIGDLISDLKQFDKDASVFVTTQDNYSFPYIEISSDTEEDMGNDVYITGLN